jgi:hypothetical protein
MKKLVRLTAHTLRGKSRMPGFFTSGSTVTVMMCSRIQVDG